MGNMDSHRQSRRNTPLFILIFLTAIHSPLPARDTRMEVHSEKSSIAILPGAVFSGSNSSGRQFHQLTHLTLRGEPFDDGGTWQALLEVRRISDPPTDREEAESGGTEKHPLLSFEIDHSLLYLSAGSRFLPGAPTALFSRPELRSSFSELPHGRTKQTVFFQPFPRWTFPLPGLFGVHGESGPGLFWADPGRTCLIAYHPGSGEGVIALDRMISLSTYPLRLSGDLRSARKTVEGFLDLIGGVKDSPDPFPLHFRLEGRREARWDYCDSEEKIHCPERRGKSGLVALSFSTVEILEGELVGQDRGMERLRLGGLALRFRFFEAPLFLILRVRHYLRDRGSISNEAEGEEEGSEGKAIDGRRAERGGALGFQIGEGALRFRILLEKKEVGPESGEAGFTVSRDRFQLGLGVAMQRTSDPAGLLYLHSPTLYESEGRFILNRRGALILRFRSPFFHFYLLSLERAGKGEHYAGLQIRLRF